MSHKANDSAVDYMADFLEGIDVEIFLEHESPGWFDNYKCDAWEAFYQVTEDMSVEKIHKIADESGCKL